MATFQTFFLYTLTPGGTNQYTVNGEILNGQATGDAIDDTISVGEDVPMVFDTQIALNGDFTYIGYEPGLAGVVAESVSNPGTFYLFSQNPIAIPNQNFNIQPIDIPANFCFLAGSMIATPGGGTAVEELMVGDLILTADGRAVPVRWMGRQTIVSFFGLALRRQPVEILAGALGGGLPARALRVTADHALLIDGVLVQAGALVNGSTIRRMTGSELGPRFVVYHIELEHHDIVLAEGAPAETFIDNVSRRGFDNYAEFEQLYGDAPMLSELALPRAMSARQVPAATRARIEAARCELMREAA